MSGIRVAVLFALVLAFGMAAGASETGWQIQPGERLEQAPGERGWIPLPCYEGIPALVTRAMFKELPTTASLDHVWYRRRFEVPAAWAGRSVWFRIDQVEGRAVVRVGGQIMGEVSRLEPEVNISAATTPGRPVVVEVFVTRDPAAAGLAPQADPVLEHIAAFQKTRYANGIGLVGESALIARGGRAWIGDIEVRTLHDAGRIEVRVKAGGRLAGLRCGGAVLPLTDPGEASVPIPDQPATDNLLLARDFAGRPWRLDAPHLYRLEIRLTDEAGNEVDRCEKRFGVREVSVRGRDVLLNGRRTPWRMMGPITQSPITGLASVEKFAPDSAIGRFWAALGVNLWQLQPNGDFWWRNVARGGWLYIDDRMLTRCDEAGIGVTLPIPPVATNRGLIFSIDRDPVLAAAYRREVEAFLSRYRHHPCIQAYTVGMNLIDTTSYMRNISPHGMGKEHNSPTTYARMRDAIAAGIKILHEIDPTVPTYVHAGGFWGGDLHGANQHMNLLPLAEYERWPETWSQEGEAPWIGDEAGTPFFGDFMYRRYGKVSGFDNKDPEPAITETCAEILGDDAYRLETPGMRREPRAGIGHLESYGTTHMQAPERHGRVPALEQVMCRYYPRVLQFWRAAGIQGTVPWLMEWSYAWQSPSPTDPLAVAYAGANQRLLAFISGDPEPWRHERHVVAGEPVKRSAVVVYDGPRDRCAVSIRWRLLASDGRELATGNGSVDVAAGGKGILPIVFVAPPVKERTEALLSLDASGDGIEQHDTRPLVVWPPSTRPDPVAVRFVDPAGDTTTTFTGLIKEDPSGLLVIGRKALSGMSSLPFTAAEVAAGLKVLIMEQTPEDLFRLGLRSEERGFRQAFVRDLPGIRDSDLAEWRGDAGLMPAEAPPSYWSHRLVMLGMKAQRPARCGTHGNVVSVAIETPQRGAFRPLVECGFDLAYSGLLEWRHGRGRVVFCQLDLTGRAGVDPAATQVARAVLGAASAPGQNDRPVAIIGSGAEAEALAQLGFASGSGNDAVQVAPIGQPGPCDLGYATRAASTETMDAADKLNPRQIGEVTVGPALLRFRAPLPVMPGKEVIEAEPVATCRVAITAADALPKAVGRLTALRLRTLYQRMITGLGGRSAEDVAARITTLGAAPPMPGGAVAEFIPLADFQVAEPARVGGLAGRDLLTAPWDPAALRWQELKPLLARRDAAGYGGDAANGQADLAAAFAIRPSPDVRSAVRTRFTLAKDTTVNLYAGADYFATVMLDGEPVIDLSQQQGAPDRLAAQIRRSLPAGEHTLEVRLVSGSGGFWSFLAVDAAPTPRGKADFIPDIARHGRWMRPYNPPGSTALYLTPRSDDDDPYLYYLW
jgi:beta-galactosidase